jgi:hypothetical protein
MKQIGPITYTEKYFGMAELAKNISEHPLVKNRKFAAPVNLFALSNDFGVDFSTSSNDCSFRKSMLEKGYSVSRRTDQMEGSIGISQKIRSKQNEKAIKVAIAYLYYNNGLLTNGEGKVIK